MRTRALPLCLLLGLALAAVVARGTFAQKPTDLPLESVKAPSAPVFDTVRPDAPPDGPAGERLLLADPSFTGELPVAPPPLSPSPTMQGLLGDEPLRAADEFVQRTSKEVRNAVVNLANKAESLRARLEKIEAAQRRLQSVLRALEVSAEDHECSKPMLPGPSPLEGTIEDRLR